MLENHSYFRSHMFSLSQTELAMHENLIACIIFSNQGFVRVIGQEDEMTAKIICIKPDVIHKVFIPEGGAEILYLDGVKLHHHFDDFEELNEKWTNIPDAFYEENHDMLDSFRAFLSYEDFVPNHPIIAVIEDLYQIPLNRMKQDELAQKLGLERTQALRYFKSVTGQTFRRFKKWAAMISVTSSVLNGQIISHAGLDAGFSDAAHTTRTAKEVFGLTPTDGATSLRSLSTLQRGNTNPTNN